MLICGLQTLLKEIRSFTNGFFRYLAGPKASTVSSDLSISMRVPCKQKKLQDGICKKRLPDDDPESSSKKQRRDKCSPSSPSKND